MGAIPGRVAITAGTGTTVGTFTVTRVDGTDLVQATLTLEWVFTLATAAGVTIVPGLGGGNATYLVGFQNVANVAQTITFDVFDNATTATGTKVSAPGALGPSQIVEFPAPGIPLALGCVVNLSAAATGGIMIMVR